MLTKTLLPPPVFHPDACAAGGDGVEGCRACVTACPESALTARPGPAGTEIAVDELSCVRCGACTAVCPTSSLERAFLPDDELRALVAASVVPGRPLLVIGEHHDLEIAGARSAGWGVAPVPSVLIVDTTSLVTAHLSGASAIAVAGCTDCHRGALHLVEPTADAAGALVGRSGVTLIADVHAEGFEEALEVLDETSSGAVSRSSSTPVDLPPAGAARRPALEHLLAAAEGAAIDDRPLAGFGHVNIDEDGCTLCGACTRACPTGAIAFDPVDGVLSARDLDCVSCGLCLTACPEKVIEVEPAWSSVVSDRRVLVSDDVVPCSVCGGPHLPARLLSHARQVVAASGRPPTQASRQLDRCPTCRSVGSDGLRVRPAVPVEPIGVPLPDRRSFIAGSAAATVGGVLGMIATGAEPAAAAATTARDDVEPGRLGMVIDLRKCIGCHACTAVCKAENHVPLGVFRDWVEEYVIGEYPEARPTFVPKLCNHCTDPGCLRACPTGAIFKRADGIVDLDHDMCIGCRACNQACPYGATFVDPVRHTADKCNLCAHRVDEGLRPACVDVCPSQCRVFGDLDDPDSAPRRLMEENATTVLRPELGLGPNVAYVGMPTDLGEPTTATTTGHGSE
ncbi:MAG: 4Fe-4S dicluster domain-containing protein [Acidimicrobiales bacterium]|nr:4Fe-4S dicluster domain-containing protein [Acidimicrobiales bacterium]